MTVSPWNSGAALRAVALLVGFALTGAHTSARPADPPAPVVPATACAPGALVGGARCETPDLRDVFVDYDALAQGERSGGEWLSYDYAELTRPILPAELPVESALSVATRLIISEVGADRLLNNRYGLAEALGILYTVKNRLDPNVYNPMDVAVAPTFPGCGPDGDFASCADPKQYLGLSTWRALDPASRYSAAILEPAVDLAVRAWWLFDQGVVPDLTDGATNYVHRCGGAGYGLTTHHCDAHMGHPRGDVRGANPHTGPLVFRAPEVFLKKRGFYSLYQSKWVDYAAR